MSEQAEYSELVHRDEIVQTVARVLVAGQGLADIPSHIAMIIDQNMWQDRIIHQTGERATFTRFEDFVTTPPLQGLGTRLDVLKKLCEGTPAQSKVLGALSALNQNGTNRFTVEEDRGNNITPMRGDSQSYKLARLKRDNPDLAEKVIEGELSAHAAAVEAGFANPKVSINLKDLSSAARTICRKLDRDEVLELIDHLYNELHD